MADIPGNDGPVMRLFEARAKPGCVDTLAEKLSSVSIDVVKDRPGNLGYLFGQGTDADADTVVFASFWESLDAVKERFGAAWQSSHLPDGYADLIDDCFVRHISMAGGVLEIGAGPDT